MPSSAKRRGRTAVRNNCPLHRGYASAKERHYLKERQMPEQWPFRFSLPPTADGGKPVTAEEAEQILLKQLETQERKEEDVLWDLAKLYSLTGRQILAFDCVQRLVEIAENAEKKAACHLAMGQLMEQMQDFGTAIQYYSQALTLEPVNNTT